MHGYALGERSSGGIWKFKTSSFKCYVDHSHTMYSSGNIDVRNWVHLFESPCIIYFVDRQPQKICSKRFLLFFHPFTPRRSHPSLSHLSPRNSLVTEPISQSISSQISTPAIRRRWLNQAKVQSPIHSANNQSLPQSYPDSATQHLFTVTSDPSYDLYVSVGLTSMFPPPRPSIRTSQGFVTSRK